MRHFIPALLSFALFCIMLIFPEQTFNGASKGLSLWFNQIFPTLFPYMIISSIIVRSGFLHLISKSIGTLCQSLFHISPHSSFVVISGFLCGYPMGARTTADLIHQNILDKSEGNYLLSFCNNTSPAFILGFILSSYKTTDHLFMAGLIILLISPVICGQIFYIFYYKKLLKPNPLFRLNSSQTAFVDVLDISIMNGIDSIVKIGGYIIFFSVIINLFQSFTANSIQTLFLSLTELSNGLLLINESILPTEIKWILLLTLSSFGGFCSIAQTGSMIKESGLSLKVYTIEKLITAFVTSLLSILYLIIRYTN